MFNVVVVLLLIIILFFTYFLNNSSGISIFIFIVLNNIEFIIY
jgi:hypothetical protein